MDDDNISVSWIDYIKQKYKIPYLEHIIYLLLLSKYNTLIQHSQAYAAIFSTQISPSSSTQ